MARVRGQPRVVSRGVFAIANDGVRGCSQDRERIASASQGMSVRQSAPALAALSEWRSGIVDHSVNGRHGSDFRRLDATSASIDNGSPPTGGRGALFEERFETQADPPDARVTDYAPRALGLGLVASARKRLCLYSRPLLVQKVPLLTPAPNAPGRE